MRAESSEQAKVKCTLATLCLLVLVGGLSASRERQAQQEHISPPVRAAVSAALGPHVSDADVIEFLRSAKLASRTKRDTDVVALLDEVVNLARSAEEDDDQAKEYRRESQKFKSMPPEEKQDCSDPPYGSQEWVKDCEKLNELGPRINREHHDKAIHSEEVAQNYENESKRRKEQIRELVLRLQSNLN